MKNISLCLITLIGVLISCVSTAKKLDISEVSAKSELSALDHKLWEQSDYEIKTLKKSGLIYTDADLDIYLKTLGNNILPDSLKNSVFDFKFYVINDPELNAFALPNASIFVHVGLLARIENKHQLAMILGHEMVHVINRHSAHRYSQINNTSGFLQILSLATAIGFGASGSNMAGFWNGLAQSGLNLTAMASVSGFGRSAEQEADLIGLKYMRNSNHNLYEAPKVFEIFLKEYTDPSAAAAFFYADHPQLIQRVNYLKAEIQKIHSDILPLDSSYTDTTYLDLTYSLWQMMPELWLQNGKHEKAINESIALLTADSTDAAAHFWLAQSIIEKNSSADSLEIAEYEYLEAIKYDSTYADPYKGLGNYYELVKDTSNAISNFQKYLDYSEWPKDGRFIKNKIKQLGATEDEEL